MTDQNADISASFPVDGGEEVHVAHQQGKRPYQEDRFTVRSGLKVAARDARAFLKMMFATAMARTIRHKEIGATGTAAMIGDDMKLHFAFVGDSPLVLILRDPKTNEVTVTKLTHDHHAVADREKIEKAGGFVDKDGYAGGLTAMSRVFGDAAARGLLRRPEVGAVDLKPYLEQGMEVQIALMSDGLTERTKPTRLAEALQKDLKNHPGHYTCADEMAWTAYDDGSTDNLTAMVMKVPSRLEPGRNIFLGLSDGHGGAEVADIVIKTFEEFSEKGWTPEMEGPAREAIQAELAPHSFTEKLQRWVAGKLNKLEKYDII